MPTLRWAIVTGEYPPHRGGVGDYTSLLAEALVEAGDEVHVWVPACSEAPPAELGVQVHPLPGRFGPRALARLGADLDRLPRPYRLLVQYVPHAMGWKAMNLPFCFWVASRRQDRISVMFHEVAFPFGWNQPFRHNVLAAVTHAMAALIGRSAHQILVAIPAWQQMLERLGVGRRNMTWVPVPSSIPTRVDSDSVAQVRAHLAQEPGTHLLGHFGTYGSPVAGMLHQVLPEVLAADVRRSVLLLGAGSEAFYQDLRRHYPEIASRVRAVGFLPADRLSTHLSACDALLQPYPDGVSTRRTSVMAGLALGLPIVTTEGHLTEALWQASDAIELVPVKALSGFGAAIERVISDPERRRSLGANARALYNERFAIEHTVSVLRSFTEKEIIG